MLSPTDPTNKPVLDRRVRRSRQRLQQALLTLVAEQPYASLTVAQLAKEADITRRTFYQHFKSIDALLDHCIAQLLDQILADVEDRHLRLPLTQNGLIPLIFNHVQENRAVLPLILQQDASHVATTCLARYVKATYARILHVNGIVQTEPLLGDYFTAYFTAAANGIIGHWAERGLHESPERLAGIFGALIGPSVDMHFRQLQRPGR